MKPEKCIPEPADGISAPASVQRQVIELSGGCGVSSGRFNGGLQRITCLFPHLLRSRIRLDVAGFFRDARGRSRCRSWGQARAAGGRRRYPKRSVSRLRSVRWSGPRLRAAGCWSGHCRVSNGRHGCSPARNGCPQYSQTRRISSSCHPYVPGAAESSSRSVRSSRNQMRA